MPVLDGIFALLPTQVNHRVVLDREEVDQAVIIVANNTSGLIDGPFPLLDFPLDHAKLPNLFLEFESVLRKKNKTSVRYSAYGLMFPKDYVYSKGGRPVIYEQTDVAKGFLPKEEWWRIVCFDLSNADRMVDWSHERERSGTARMLKTELR